MNRYARQIIFRPLGAVGQEKLRAARALVVGCGALGTHSAELLARSGIGSLRLVDRDVVEWTNLHRQGGFEETHARERTPKAVALASWLGRVNSDVEIEVRAVDFNFKNALELAANADIILDGTDNLPTRFLLNDVSYRQGVPWIYAGAVGSAAHVQAFSGRAGPCLRCQLPALPPPGTLGTCDTTGILGPAAALAASWQAALAMKALTEESPTDLWGRKALLDPWTASARVVPVQADTECAVCALGHHTVLDGALAERSTILCGRSAVQVLPAELEPRAIDLSRAAERLSSLGSVENRGGLIRVKTTEGFTLTLFGDGRAIFDGLTDPVRARTLYARFVGQ